jgi:hypothetical protein
MAREGVLPTGDPIDCILGHCPAIQALWAPLLWEKGVEHDRYCF